MISIIDALILAGLAGIGVFFWFEKGRVDYLEEENNELWENFSHMAEELEVIKQREE